MEFRRRPKVAECTGEGLGEPPVPVLGTGLVMLERFLSKVVMVDLEERWMQAAGRDI